MTLSIFHWIPLPALATLLLACSPKTPEAQPAPPALSQGYLAAADIPDSIAISPPPPAPGSVWARLDDQIAAHALTLQGSARFEQARVDAGVQYTSSDTHFACALGVIVGEAETPTLYRLLARSRADVRAAIRPVKEHYQRPRPFILNGQPTCTPGHEDGMRTSSTSYPSGHTAAGWAWALLLAEIVPERATEIIQRGRSYGQSRVVCNVHWYSDTVQGQALAAAVVAKLHSNAEFLNDLAKARDELAQARQHAAPLAHDCAAEAAALATPFPELR